MFSRLRLAMELMSSLPGQSKNHFPKKGLSSALGAQSTRAQRSRRRE